MTFIINQMVNRNNYQEFKMCAFKWSCSLNLIPSNRATIAMGRWQQLRKDKEAYLATEGTAVIKTLSSQGQEIPVAPVAIFSMKKHGYQVYLHSGLSSVSWAWLAAHNLPLQGGGSEGCMTLHNLHEQRDPPWRAEGPTGLRSECDAPDEAQCTPAPVLLPAHQSVWRSCQRRQSTLEPRVQKQSISTTLTVNSLPIHFGQ